MLGSFSIVFLTLGCSQAPSDPAPDHRRTREDVTQEVIGHASPAWLPDVGPLALDPLLQLDAHRLLTSVGELDFASYFIPGGDRLAIYCQGHRGDARIHGLATIHALRDAGFAVLVVNMPQLGENSALPSGSRSHDSLGGADYPLRYFVEPVMVALNWLCLLREWEDVRMVGLSGGGWTTVLVAALDERITSSVAVAGSMPPDLRDQDPGSYGDLEQRLTYGLELDLYALATNAVHVFNSEDPCCFPGRLYNGYADAMDNLTVIVEDRSAHDIGPMALQEMTR